MLTRMKELERIEAIRTESARKAYQRGVLEGWQDALWFFSIIAVGVVVVAGLP